MHSSYSCPIPGKYEPKIDDYFKDRSGSPVKKTLSATSRVGPENKMNPGSRILAGVVAVVAFAIVGAAAALAAMLLPPAAPLIAIGVWQVMGYGAAIGAGIGLGSLAVDGVRNSKKEAFLRDEGIKKSYHDKLGIATKELDGAKRLDDLGLVKGGVEEAQKKVDEIIAKRHSFRKPEVELDGIEDREEYYSKGFDEIVELLRKARELTADHSELFESYDVNFVRSININEARAYLKNAGAKIVFLNNNPRFNHMPDEERGLIEGTIENYINMHNAMLEKLGKFVRV